jgi:ArsR family metal-binding transcriptional regulator
LLLQSYHLNVFAPPCDPGAERWAVKAALDDDIGDSLPYLNATLKGAIYNHAARALTWRMGGHAIAIRPREIAISNLCDQEAAAIEVKRMADIINRTWDRRTEITPSIDMRRRLKLMEVYKYLPATNCKVCGQPTCFTFALKVTAGEVEIEQCAPLFTEAFHYMREKMLTLIENVD